MALQAYIDDSGSHKRSPVYVLAGLISTVENWKAFSDEWKSKLDEYPTLAYFKMTEAVALRGQFQRGWTSDLRDQRVFELCEIIKKHVMVRIDSWLYRKHFDSIVAGIDSDSALSDPYYACFYQLVFSILTYRLEHGEVDCDMIFDDQGSLGYHAIQGWDSAKIVPADMDRAQQRADLLARTDPPIFRDDKKFLPLQAADLLAWLVNERLSSPRDHVLFDACTKSLREIPTISRHFDEAGLRKLGAALMIWMARKAGALPALTQEEFFSKNIKG